MTSDTTTVRLTTGLQKTVSTYSYTDVWNISGVNLVAGTAAYQGGVVTRVQGTVYLDTTFTGNSYVQQSTTDTRNCYAWNDTAFQHFITVDTVGANAGHGTTDFEATPGGQLTYVRINGGQKEIKFVSNAAGQVMSRTEFTSTNSNATNDGRQPTSS